MMNSQLFHDEQGYRVLSQAIYDTYALLEEAKALIRSNDIEPVEMFYALKDVEAGVDRVYTGAGLLNVSVQELSVLATRLKEQRDKALSKADSNYDQGWYDGISYLLNNIASQNVELLTQLLHILLKDQKQFPLLSQLIGMMTEAMQQSTKNDQAMNPTLNGNEAS